MVSTVERFHCIYAYVCKNSCAAALLQARRGMMVSLNELGIVCGILAAFLVNVAFVNVEHGW